MLYVLFLYPTDANDPKCNSSRMCCTPYVGIETMLPDGQYLLVSEVGDCVALPLSARAAHGV